jgi:hypothetical protein
LLFALQKIIELLFPPAPEPEPLPNPGLFVPPSDIEKDTTFTLPALKVEIQLRINVINALLENLKKNKQGQVCFFFGHTGVGMFSWVFHYFPWLML